MVPYAQQFRFRRKDFLASGDPDKLITGAEIMAEFKGIQRSLNSHTPSTYTILTNFAAKDSLARGDSEKIVDGNELEAEFTAVRTAIISLGGTYTRAYNFATLDDDEEEILGLHFESEFAAIATALDTIRFLDSLHVTLTDHTTISTGTIGSGSQQPSLSLVFDDNGQLSLLGASGDDASLTLDGDLLPSTDEDVAGEWSTSATAADSLDIRVTYTKTDGTLTSSTTGFSDDFATWLAMSTDRVFIRQIEGSFDTTFEDSTWTVEIRTSDDHTAVATKDMDVSLVIVGGPPIPVGPTFDQVVLQLHCEGADGDVIFTDSSSYNHTIGGEGGAGSTSVTQKKFGVSSLRFNASTSYICGLGTLPEYDLSTGDFTVEGFVFGASGGFLGLDTVTAFSKGPAGSTSYPYIVYLTAGLKLTARGADSGGNIVYSIVDAATFDLDVWTHIALTREGSNFRLFKNGIQVGSTVVSSATLGTNTEPPRWGSYTSAFNHAWYGYMDELRIIKGFAVYTADFTPPSAPFPDS